MCKMLNVNCASQAFMSKYFVPKFLTRFNKTSKKSAIINYSSMAAYGSKLLETPYAGTKAFNQLLSRAMEKEYSKEIEVMNVTPAFVRTKMCPDMYLF